MSNPPPSPSEHHFLIVKKFQKCLHYKEQLPSGTGGVSNLGLQAGVSLAPDFIPPEPPPKSSFCSGAWRPRLYYLPDAVGSAQTRTVPAHLTSSFLDPQGPLPPEARLAHRKLLPRPAGKAGLAHTLRLPRSLAGGTFGLRRGGRPAGQPLGSGGSGFHLPRVAFWVGSVA